MICRLCLTCACFISHQDESSRSTYEDGFARSVQGQMHAYFISLP